MRAYILILFTWLSGLLVQAQQVQQYHTIQKGETLFHLTQVYQVTAEAICNLNPGLSASNFQIGQTIAIPASNGQVEQTRKVEQVQTNRPADAKDNYQTIHKVSKKETIFGICMAYGITENELRAANPEMNEPGYVLKKGKFLVIPFHEERVVQEIIPTDQELIDPHRKAEHYDPLRVVLVLPFSSAEYSKAFSARQYYQGFMLAVDSLKKQGINLDIYVMDSGKREEKIDSLLHTSTLAQAHLLLFPQVEQSQNKVAKFSNEHRILTLVTRSEQTSNSPYLFVFNPSTEQTNQQVSSYFVRQFKDAEIFILDMKDTSNSRRGELTKKLRDTLTEAGLTYKFLNIEADKEALLAALSKNKQNVIVPNSANLNLLRRQLLPNLKAVADAAPSCRITLFGHQEWLSMANELKAVFYELDTYIYSKWWLNPNTAAAKTLAANYKQWFHQDMPTKMPSVPVIGFDSSYYLMKGLAQFGSTLPYTLNQLDAKPVQSFIDYERLSSWGGFQNQKIGFVHFNKKVVNVEF